MQDKTDCTGGMQDARDDLTRKFVGLPVGERGPVNYVLAGAACGFLVQLYSVSFDKNGKVIFS